MPRTHAWKPARKKETWRCLHCSTVRFIKVGPKGGRSRAYRDSDGNEYQWYPPPCEKDDG